MIGLTIGFATIACGAAASPPQVLRSAPSEAATDYLITHMHGTWRPGAFGIVLAVENVTNEDYQLHGSGSNEAGRNFVLGLEMRF